MSKILEIFKRSKREEKPDFRELITNSTDEELVKILKQRTYYIPEAARVAVEEAIRRGIIHSEQDLLHEKYRVEELRFTWFPKPLNNKNRTRLRKSLGRSLVLCGILPLVYGLIKLNAGNQLEGGFIMGFALIWISLTSQLIRTFPKEILYALMAANVIGASYVFIRLINFNHSPFMDLFVAFLLFALITYGLIYLYKIRSISDDLKS